MLTVREIAAVNRLAATVAPLVTNSAINDLAKQLGFGRTIAGNKTKKVQILLNNLLSDGRSRSTATLAISTLALEGHHRTLGGTAAMTIEDADGIVAAMKELGLQTGELGRSAWRAGLKAKPAPAPVPVRETTSTPVERISQGTTVPIRHEQGLGYLAQLAADPSRPQHRDEDDAAVIAALCARTGIHTPSDVIRLAIREACEARGIDPVRLVEDARFSRQVDANYGKEEKLCPALPSRVEARRPSRLQRASKRASSTRRGSCAW